MDEGVGQGPLNTAKEDRRGRGIAMPQEGDSRRNSMFARQEVGDLNGIFSHRNRNRGRGVCVYEEIAISHWIIREGGTRRFASLAR